MRQINGSNAQHSRSMSCWEFAVSRSRSLKVANLGVASPALLLALGPLMFLAEWPRLVNRQPGHSVPHA